LLTINLEMPDKHICLVILYKAKHDLLWPETEKKKKNPSTTQALVSLRPITKYLSGRGGECTAMLTATMKPTVAYGDASTKPTNI